MDTLIVRRESAEAYTGLADLPPILQRIYAARHIQKVDDLGRELKTLPSFNSLSNIQVAAERLAKAIQNDEKIIIVGDFDADGATSTALGVSALQAFGASQVESLIPNRFTFGYGLTPEIVDVAKEQNPGLIITVDNGVASLEGVARANELGIDVVVTDHHLPGATLPDAVAIVNPNLQDDQFPCKSLAGVGVIFYVMLALRACLKQKNWFELQNLECPNMANFLDLVALGTIADVVPLDKTNRTLVYNGLKRIRGGIGRPGIKAMLDVAGRRPDQLTASDLGFVIGPRLNAAGRLDDMSLGVQCLATTSFSEAREMAERLDSLNKERRSIEAKMRKEAFDIIDHLDFEKKLPLALALYDESWHQGVVGLVASRVKDKTHRPVIAFAKSEDGTLKGSARSVKGLHIRDLLDAIATQHPHILSKFGGHAMAAGLTLAPEHYEKFAEAFEKEVSKHLAEKDLRGSVETDGALNEDEFTFQNAELLRDSGPWGQSFPEPVFDGEFRIFDQRIVGTRHLKFVMQVPGSDNYLDCIAFNVNTDEWPNHHCAQARLVYKLDINEYNGRQKLQLIIQDILPLA